ncbi:hypothetical protein BpHYR1_038863 [Brachionus plicatilis]|uniref:Uncharacterized protein n=1 Tax=Brachionus plicatilis TaxID=10195 RepID=A0A3M7RQE0_BRAPC|nr:hypothetical protein BpHYR1_038863 [Brachionus plicatilis]
MVMAGLTFEPIVAEPVHRRHHPPRSQIPQFHWLKVGFPNLSREAKNDISIETYMTYVSKCFDFAKLCKKKTKSSQSLDESLSGESEDEGEDEVYSSEEN